VGPHLTQSPGPRPTSIPSGILIHRAVWPQRTWAENWGGCAPLGDGELTQCAKTYLHAKFHLDPSNRLANVTDRIDRTQSNSITNGRPKPKAKFSCLLRHPAWKCRGPILILALHKFVIYLLRHPLTYSLRTHTGHGKPHKKYLGAL